MRVKRRPTPPPAEGLAMPAGRLGGRRIAVVYDCLFPYTVGGGERWYRTLTEGLAEEGAVVTYLTRRQWDEPPVIAGVEVVPVSGRSSLYDEHGVRKTVPTIRFGVGLCWWLLRNRRRFDAVQVASFPFWSVLAVRLALVGCDVEILVDWFELWSSEFWQSYAGRLTGRVGFRVQQLCLRLSPKVVVLSARNAERLVRLGRADPPLVLAGFLPDGEAGLASLEPRRPAEPPTLLFVGRHIRDKGVDLLPEAFALVKQTHDSARLVVTGDGPLRPWLVEELLRRGLADSADVLGFVTDEDLERLLGEASCLIAPSRREGYGIAVVDAMARGTPVVTAAFAENLAVDHIDNANGRIADPPTPSALAAAIGEVLDAGWDLRLSTQDWYMAHSQSKTVSRSVAQMIDWYLSDGIR